MMILPQIMRSTLYLGLIAAASAAHHPELDRVIPVPDDQPIPLVDFCRPDLFSTPNLNPTGTKLAAVVNTDDDYHAILIYDIQTAKIEKVGGSRIANMHNFRWLTDSRLLAWVGYKDAAEMGLYTVDIEKDGIAVNPVAKSSYLALIGVPDARPTYPIMRVTGGYVADRRVAQQALVLNSNLPMRGEHSERDVASSKDYPYGIAASLCDSFVEPSGGLSAGYFCDAYGELAYGYTADKGFYYLNRWNGKSWEPYKLDLDKWSPTSVDLDPEKLLVTPRDSHGAPRGLFTCDPKSGTIGEPIFADEKYDLDYVYVKRDYNTKRILGLYYDRSGPSVQWLDEGYRTIQVMLNKMFPGEIVKIGDSDRANKRLLFTVTSDRNPGVYNLLDLETLKVSKVKSAAPWFDPKRLSPMQVMWYKTRDGHKIEGYLTLPRDTSKANPAPLVVLPHGGPWARDVYGFNREVQILANAGYAVFQPNYRGSTSYQSAFTEEDVYDFEKMHNDVTDGVKTLIRSGLVDPKRIGILGGSFGGYLSVCGIAFERGLYRCAVTMAGVFDWETMIKEVGRDDDLGNRAAWYKRHIGDPAKQSEKMARISPLRHLEGVTVPVFVTHGRDDTTVPIGQSKALLSALDDNHVPYEKYFMTDERHGVFELDHRIEFYTRILAFLDKNLKNAK